MGATVIIMALVVASVGVIVVLFPDFTSRHIMVGPLEKGKINILRDEILYIHVDEGLVLIEFLADLLDEGLIGKGLPVLHPLTDL